MYLYNWVQLSNKKQQPSDMWLNMDEFQTFHACEESRVHNVWLHLYKFVE